jgi:homoserine O-acetyltransferase
MGASMGALQAFEWGAAYPEIVERIIPVAGAPALDAFGIETMNLWGMPIMQDPDWNHGDYYGGRGPKTGLELSVKIMTLQARASGWEWEEDGRKPALWHNPTHSLLDKFLIEDRLDEFAVGRAKKIDANSLLYLARAVQLFVVGGASSADEGLKLIKAKVLLISASSDLLFPPAQIEKIVENMKANGNSVTYFKLQGRGGHYDGIAEIDQAEKVIRKFLSPKFLGISSW